MTCTVAKIADTARRARFRRARHVPRARHVGNVPHAGFAPGLSRAILRLTILLALCADAHAGARQAAQKVREGIAHFRAEEYEQAAKAFAGAEVSRPEDPWIAFDRACAYAAQGEADKAVELFEQAAMTRDRKLAVRSRYNLGVMAAEKARALFGDKPEEARREVRAEGLALLTEAVRHYRDCLELDEDHADARHNLELIRLWIKHVEALWRRRDREKERKEKRLLEFLLTIEGRQRALRGDAKSLAVQAHSPRRRQALATAESSQRTLAEEIGPLEEKIAAEVGSAKPQGPSPPQASGSALGNAPLLEAAEEAVERLTGLADQAREAMLRAADDLQGGSPDEAAQAQKEAVEKLDRIYGAIVPFADLVGRAIATEQGLVDRVAPVAEKPAALLAAEAPEVLVEVTTLRGRPVETVYEGQSVLYTVTLNHVANPSPPKLEGLDDFEVTPLGERSLDSTRVTIINGQMTQVVRQGREYRYRLTPKKTGELRIPAPVAEVDGKVLEGPERTLRVRPAEEQDVVSLAIRNDRRSVYPMQPFEVTLSVAVRALPEPRADRSPVSVQAELRRDPPALRVPWLDEESLPDGLEPDADLNAWARPLLDRRGAVARARRRLHRGTAELGEGRIRQGADLLEDAFVGLVADVADLPEASLTPKDVSAQLQDLDLEAELVGRVGDLLETCDAARYGVSNPADGLGHRAEEVLDDVIRSLKSRRRFR